MKKKVLVLLVLGLVALLASGLTGLALDDGHQAVKTTSEKLVGTGPMGRV